MATPVLNPIMAIAAAMGQAAIDNSPFNVQFSSIFAATSPPAPTAAQIKAAADVITACGPTVGVITGPPAAPTGITSAIGLLRAALLGALANQGLLGRG